MALETGTQLGPYEILATIGAGGMGEVYRARDTRLDRTVAIKVLPAQLSADHSLRERFEREARVVSQLTHPHICTLYDVGHEGEIAFLVMEYLEGETLAARIARGALPIEEALRTAAEVAEALDRAHRHGIVHRDLKPGNVFLVRGGGASFSPAHCQAARLRAGSCGCIARCRRHDRAAHITHAADTARRRARHISVHGARTTRRARRRCTERHLCVRRSYLRNGHWSESVRREESGQRHCRNPRTPTAGDVRGDIIGADRTRAHRRDVSGQRP